MKSFVALYSSILNKITDFVGVIAGILLFIPAIVVFYEVVMRGLFNSPTEWSIELSIYCVLVAGFLGMAVAYGAGKHIRVDILIMNLSPKTRCYIEIGTSIVGAFFCAVFFMEALDMTLLSLEINRTAPSTFKVPLWIPQSALPIGMGLLFLHFVKTILEDILKIAEDDFAKEENK